MAIKLLLRVAVITSTLCTFAGNLNVVVGSNKYIEINTLWGQIRS